MLVLGDLACPNEDCAEQLKKEMKEIGIFNEKLLLCNLEGMICDSEPYNEDKLFNHSSVLEVFAENKTVFSLANNHTYDFPELIDATMEILRDKKFYYNGIMHENRIEPTELSDHGKKIAIFTHCWGVYTKTNQNLVNEKKVIDCFYDHFCKIVSEYLKKNKDVQVLCYFHWNYDLEELPFIMHRKLARHLIDLGVYAVIGNHAHVPQGGELYKGRAIVYGLGNFYIPSNYFFGGKLNYPEKSKIMMVLELKDNPDEIMCHWFQTDTDKCLNYICSESFENGEYINLYSPYRKMNDKEYEQFFKKNRKKSFLVPIFKDYVGIKEKTKERIAIFRIKLIKKLKG